MIRISLFITSLGILFLHTSNVAASTYMDTSIESLIDSADLIISGKVENKSSQSEDVIVELQTKENNKISTRKVNTRTPMTSFVIKIDEVIKGQHSEEFVTVKMEGGCGDDGMCLEDSTNYNYQVNDNIVIFLKFDQDNNYYYSSDGNLTAFKQNENKNIYREDNFKFIEKNTNIVRNETNKLILSIDELKSKVKEILDNQSRAGTSITPALE
ncbi:hypothetical protein [Marinicella litoralis]|uniref:Uncharacterized protein n=1 Tax=Marinicella litoralis TaxID=644220 RepID=A0A4R6Y365_9GAMM|nr:hypothetical protein [Marinicella litoralis]TDR23478.1 hypothetical protein C8D91_0339 [Marinicella litoralis]